MSGVGRPPSRARGIRLAEIVAADLREQILTGGFDGDSLPKQDDLMDMFGVSGPSLREALRILEAEGLVTVRRGKVGGAEIHRPSGASAAYMTAVTLQGERTTLDDLSDALRMLEPPCAALCAERPDREALGESLEANLTATEEAIGDGVEFTSLARGFHGIVVDHVLNPAIRLVVRSLVSVWTAQQETWADQASLEGRYPDTDSQVAVFRTHRRIAREILAGEGAAAERTARKHLEASHAVVLADLGGGRLIDAVSARAVEEFRRQT
ncbi:FadR/GntR family transcriptional regulator [Euzebya sp.]|uniref:FadR/GntR family transcriptional regulator n=1 Tax=Euzebya sp. TaxID=1971409 RepID=UPI0035183BC7